MNKIILIIILFLLSSSLVQAVSLSPTELRIKNLDDTKDYKFIILVTNEDEGFVEVEMKTSDEAASVSPDRFMLNGGEKRSIRLVLNARKLDEEKRKVLVQPYINDIPSSAKLTVFLESNSSITPDIQDQKSFEMIIKQPEFITIILYVLVFVVIVLSILIFLPEIKRSLDNVQAKKTAVQDRNFYKTANKKTITMLKRLDTAEKKIQNIITKVETFHSQADDWLKKNSDGTYGL